MIPTAQQNGAVRKIHFIGIGGIGMSALARWFLSQGWQVSGSDLSPSGITETLAREGVRVYAGHKKMHVPHDARVAVFNSAIPETNVELLEARTRGIETKSYPEALGELTRVYTTLAVSGAHGKSTATSMLALVFVAARRDPTVIVGTKLKEFHDSNFRAGKSKFLIIEADEYRAAFLHFTPKALLITNIDREHLDFYKNLAAIKKTFLRLISRMHEGGVLVLNRDSAPLSSLKNAIEIIANEKKLQVHWYSCDDPTAEKVASVLRVKGAHNVSNALGVYYLAERLGMRQETILKALRAFRGSWRRMEIRGTLKTQNSKLKNKVVVYDDYAHHPTEIKASLAAFREAHPGAPLVCVFQPHQAARLKALFKDFARAFRDADYTVIIPTYRVLGRDGGAGEFGAEALARRIAAQKGRGRAFYVSQPKRIGLFLARLIETERLSSPSPVVVMMGAGDIFELTDTLIRKNGKTEKQKDVGTKNERTEEHKGRTQRRKNEK